MTLEQIEANQATMRVEIDSMQAKMDQLLQTMPSFSHKERNTEIKVEAWSITPQFGSSSLNIPGVTNLEGIFIHTEGVSILVPVFNDDTLNHSSVSVRHRFVTDDEDQYDAFFLPQPTRLDVGVLPDPYVERLYNLEENSSLWRFTLLPAWMLLIYA